MIGRCECCGRKLRADEGKICRFCEGKIRKQLEAEMQKALMPEDRSGFAVICNDGKIGMLTNSDKWV